MKLGDAGRLMLLWWKLALPPDPAQTDYLAWRLNEGIYRPHIKGGFIPKKPTIRMLNCDNGEEGGREEYNFFKKEKETERNNCHVINKPYYAVYLQSLLTALWVMRCNFAMHLLVKQKGTNRVCECKGEAPRKTPTTLTTTPVIKGRHVAHLEQRPASQSSSNGARDPSLHPRIMSEITWVDLHDGCCWETSPLKLSGTWPCGLT